MSDRFFMEGFKLSIACEQALLFGRSKRAARERASERRSREGLYLSSAPRSRVLARLASLAQIGELARRLNYPEFFRQFLNTWIVNSFQQLENQLNIISSERVCLSYTSTNNAASNYTVDNFKVKKLFWFLKNPCFLFLISSSEIGFPFWPMYSLPFLTSFNFLNL